MDPNERQRLNALHDLDVLDTAAEAAFDNIVALASYVCGTPISLISLVDERRQWFKARHGLDQSELPREHAFCAHAIAGDSLFEVPDAREDRRFAENPLVTNDPHVRFYAGVPLKTAEGFNVGSLCVIDRRPRELSGEQRAALAKLAAQVVTLLGARRSTVAVRAERARLRQIFDVSPTAMALVRDPEFVFEELNDAFKSLAGPREYRGRAWRDVYGDAPDPELASAMAEVYRTGRRLSRPGCRFASVLPDGGVLERFFDFTYDRVDGPDARRHSLLINATDVTERVVHARELAEARQRLDEALDALPVGVSILEGPEYRYKFVNRIHATFYGGRIDFVGRTVREAVPEVGGGPIPDLLERVYRTGEPYFGDEHAIELRQLDGSLRKLVLKLSFQPLRDVGGRIGGIVVTSVDVTDLVHAREHVRETERLLSAATSVARVGFFEWKIPENVVTFSEQMKSSWGIEAGVSLEEVMRQVWPADRDQVSQKITRALETGEPYFAQYRITKPGAPGLVWIEAQGGVTFGEDGRPLTFFGTSIDITSRKTAESDAQAVANSIPHLAWMTDQTGYIQWYNQRWYEYTGTTFEQMRGWGWQVVQHPDHLDRVKTKFMDHLRTGEAWEDTFPLRRKDGTYRWFLSRAVPIKDDGGNIVRWFGSNTDVTDQRESARQVARLAAVIENSGDFVCILDRDLKTVFVNPGGRALVQYRPGDVVDVADFFVPGERDKITRTALPVVRRAGAWEGETLFRTFVSERAIPVWVNLFEIRDPELDEPLAYAMIGRDISERRVFERSLEEAKDQAERANAAKSVFLANMSHEIRSPLGAIMGFADLTRNSELSRAELAEYVAIITRNSQHLLRIVDDILDLSKVEAGKMMIEHIEFSFVDLLADFVSLMGFRARDKGIAFDLALDTPIPACVVSDPTRVRQILTNVVGNAIKFTERGGTRLAVEFDDGALTFTVTDTGPGITPEQSEFLFRAFQQADVSTTRKFGGTGLGLVLTRRLAEALGGRFWLAASEPGRGSTFVATVRVGRCRDLKMVDAIEMAYSADAPHVPNTEAPLRGLNILVVEDSPDNQTLFELILSRLGARVTIAKDGVEGVAAAEAGDFDVILCDVQMPRMDGYEATRELRDRGYRRPIVALTAHAMKEERERALRAGFSEFLTKPLQKDLLIEVLNRVTGR